MVEMGKVAIETNLLRCLLPKLLKKGNATQLAILMVNITNSPASINFRYNVTMR